MPVPHDLTQTRWSYLEFAGKYGPQPTSGTACFQVPISSAAKDRLLRTARHQDANWSGNSKPPWACQRARIGATHPAAVAPQWQPPLSWSLSQGLMNCCAHRWPERVLQRRQPHQQKRRGPISGDRRGAPQTFGKPIRLSILSSMRKARAPDEDHGRNRRKHKPEAD